MTAEEIEAVGLTDDELIEMYYEGLRVHLTEIPGISDDLVVIALNIVKKDRVPEPEGLRAIFAAGRAAGQVEGVIELSETQRRML